MADTKAEIVMQKLVTSMYVFVFEDILHLTKQPAYLWKCLQSHVLPYYTELPLLKMQNSACLCVWHGVERSLTGSSLIPKKDKCPHQVLNT